MTCQKEGMTMVQGCHDELLIGSLTNGSTSWGHVVFPNLGYKKDTFLELSLVSNNISSHPQYHTSLVMPVNYHNNHRSPPSSGSSTAWVNWFGQGGVGGNMNSYMAPRGELISRPPNDRTMMFDGTQYPTTNQVRELDIRIWGFLG